MTSPDTIPADIMQIAAELTNSTLRNYEKNQSAGISRDAIAKAILAERERCALVAEGNARSFDFQKALADCNDADHGHNSARLLIATEIRNPKGGA